MDLWITIAWVVSVLIGGPFVLFFCGKYAALGYFRAKQLMEESKKRKDTKKHGT